MSKKLTPEFVAMKTKNDRLENIKNLNLWGNDLDDISTLRQMYSLEVVSLSVNRIRTLKDFAKLKHLKELHIRKNMISDINEINYLNNCENLKILNLSENPVCDSKNYRLKVIEILPQLTKLDDIPVSSEEIQQSQNLNNYHNVKDQEDITANSLDLSGLDHIKNNEDENVFETNNLNDKMIYSNNNKGNDYNDEYANNRNKNVEIYSNKERNVKIKDKFNNNNNKVNKYNNYNETETLENNFYNNNDNKNKNLKRSITSNENIKEQSNLYRNKSDDKHFDYNERNKKPVNNRDVLNLNNRSGNILTCVLMLLNELNNNDLEIVKKEIEKKINNY